MPMHRFVTTLMLLAVPWPAMADLRVDATRVVYEEGAPTATSVRIHNVGKQPSLIQAWLDNGDSTQPLEQLRTPLLVTPPMFRLDERGKRDIQIRAADTSGLAKDRESLLWLNILDIPARQTGRQQRTLEFAMRWRLKVFHRPAGLAGAVDEAPAALMWFLQTDSQGHSVLQATNPTPYFVSLAQLTLGELQVGLDASTAQIPPLGRWSQALPAGYGGREADSRLEVVWIDGKGVEHTVHARVSRSNSPPAMHLRP